MPDYEYNKYIRIHKFANQFDVEKSKIHRDKIKYNKYSSMRDKLVEDLANAAEEDYEEMFEKYEELNYASQKERRNARVHKQRFNKIKDKLD